MTTFAVGFMVRPWGSLATTVGGSTPAIVTYLIHRTDNRAIPGAWLSLAAAVALIAIFLTRAQKQ